MVPGLYWRHRSRSLRRGAPITTRGACHAPCSPRRSPVPATAPDRARTALRLDDRRIPRHRMTIDRGARAIALSSLAYTALALAYTWPLLLNLAHGVAHDPSDPIVSAWMLWWTRKALPLTAQWWNAPIFYPAAGALAFSEHLLGLAPVAAPLIALTGNPLLGYNVTLIATYVLSALGAHFLGYMLTRRHDAAAVAAIAYAFAPYRLAQVPHIQVLSSYWIPVCLAALHRYDEEGRPRWAVLAAAAWLMQALSCGYYMFFLTVLVALWLAWFAAGRRGVRKIDAVGVRFARAPSPLPPVRRDSPGLLPDTY